MYKLINKKKELKMKVIKMLEDLKELAKCDSMDCVEKDNIMVSRIDKAIEEWEELLWRWRCAKLESRSWKSPKISRRV